MSKISKYFNKDIITGLQTFLIEKYDCNITDVLHINNKLNSVLNVDIIILVWLRVVFLTLVSKCFFVKNVKNVLL